MKMCEYLRSRSFLDLGPMSFIDEDLTCFLRNRCRYKLMKIHQHFAGHMTKMAAMTIHGENTINRLSRNHLILMKLCMMHQRPKAFIICINHDPQMTLTYFTAC